jgi:hypothetical protein
VGLTVVTSAAGHHRIARCRDWLKARAPAEEILIIGTTPGAANELARSIAQERRASFGYHRLTLAQLASALARPVLAAQRLAALGIQAVANRAIHRLSEAGGLGRYAKLTNGPETVGLGHNSVVRYHKPFSLNADTIVAILCVPIDILQTDTVGKGAAQSACTPKMLEPFLKRRIGKAAVVTRV